MRQSYFLLFTALNNNIIMNDTKNIKDHSINVILVSHVLHHIPDNEIKIILIKYKLIPVIVTN